MKIVSVVGTRPECIHHAPLSAALRQRKLEEIIVHTGQHYDFEMDACFFEELALPRPDVNLAVGSSSSCSQIAAILDRLGQVLTELRPSLILIRGDTNSSLAAALAAAKLCIPIAHIEAGERSYDRTQQEEQNRVLIDCVSELYFCVSTRAAQQLNQEGITEGIHCVGDVLYDSICQQVAQARRRSSIVASLGLQSKQYTLITVHRAENVDCPTKLRKLISGLNAITEPCVFPLHPRTKLALKRDGLTLAPHIQSIAAVAYHDMLMLEENARVIATDSGGVQREAYCLKVPCITLRERTEWVETLTTRWNALVPIEPERIIEAWHLAKPQNAHPSLFGDGKASEKITQIIEQRIREIDC